MKVYRVQKDNIDVFFGEIEQKGFFYYKTDIGEFGNCGTFLFPIADNEKNILDSIDLAIAYHSK